MVKVSYEPYTDLVVHEIVEQDTQVFFEDMVRQALSNPAHVEPTINWAEGVAFVVAPMPPTEDIVKENLGGKIHYASVMFTRTPYQSQVPVKIGSQNYSARLRKAENNLTLAGLARFLNDFQPGQTS
ncbi:MAG TPA: hypothetical protein VKF15_08225 [Nitrososphaerales archaeon]|nr:hypothetical protein [Nitrososphaerales archaeon]